MRQLLRPSAQSPCSEAREASTMKSSPHLLQLEKAHAEHQRPGAPQNNKQIKPLKKLYCAFYVCIQLLSHAQLFTAPWTVARQAPLSMGFSRQEQWGGWPFSILGRLLHLGSNCSSYVPCIGWQILYHYATWEACAF